MNNNIELKTQVDDFVKISGIIFAKYKNDVIYKFLISEHQHISLSKLGAAQFMKDKYNDGFYLEMIRLESEAGVREKIRIKNKILNKENGK